MKSATAYLGFNSNCREAMSFYRDCFGLELMLNAYTDETGQPSKAPNAPVMHAQLSRDGAPVLMASDAPAGATYVQGNGFSVSIECDSLDEIERLFGRLADGGRVRAPLATMPWGVRFGLLTDKYGVQWILNFAGA